MMWRVTMQYRKWMSAFFLLILMITLTACQSSSGNVETDKPEEYTPVNIQTVRVGDLVQSVVLSGRALPDKNVMVVPKMPGKVADVYVAVGDLVAQGDPLFKLDDANLTKQLEQAGAALRSARVNQEMTQDQLATAKASFERMKTLYESGAISQSQYEQAELAASTKPLEAAQAAVQQAETAYQMAQDALSDITITAPISGMIATLNTETGEMVSNAQPALVLIDVNPLYIRVDVTENLINKFKIEQEIDLYVPAVDKALTGTVTSVSPVIDNMSLLYPVQIRIDNSDLAIKSNMFAEVNFVTDVHQQVLVVPSNAVLLKNGEQVLYVEKEGYAEERIVTVGLDNGSDIEVVSGLQEGDMVIVKGQNYISDGSKVKVIRGES